MIKWEFDCLVPVVSIVIEVLLSVVEDNTAALLTLFEVTTTGFAVSLRVLVDRKLRNDSVLVGKLRVNRLNGHGKCVSRERLQFTIFLNTVHGKGTDTEGDIARGETILLKDAVDFLRSLDSDGVTVKGLDVRIENLIARGVDSTTEDILKVEYGLVDDLHAVTGVTTDEHTAVMVENLVLKGRKDVINHVPVIVGVGHAAERGVWIKLSERSLDEDALAMRVNAGIFVVRIVLGVLRGVGAHDEMLGRDRAESDLLLLTIAVVIMLKVRDDRHGGAVHE